jgi:ATP-binding cassette subfamily F protein 3
MDYRKHLQAFIDRWRYNANRAAQAQSKIKILEKVRSVGRLLLLAYLN